MTDLKQKQLELYRSLEQLGSGAVAFSAGVDSTYLLYAAHEVLGDNAVAITAKLRSVPQEELEQARQLCKDLGIRHIITWLDELTIEGFSQNPKNRCYLCKRGVFSQIISEAQEVGIFQVLEGSNTDDDNDYRPGMQAIRELGVLSPLKAAGLSKSQIRELSRQAGLPTWNKPQLACLSTRIAYGDKITPQKLEIIGKAEKKLRQLGFEQVRVRLHGTLARIEVENDRIPLITSPEILVQVRGYFAALGFTHTALDLNGYRSGSMNADAGSTADSE